MCCDYCYNVIYNTSPLYLADQPEVLKRLNPKELRLDFVNETGKEMQMISEAYQKAWIYREKADVSGMEYTRGHLKRGVK